MPEEGTAAVDYHELFNIPKSGLGKLTSGDRWWRNHQPWLAERGYMLRPRYHEGWVPSWSQQPNSFPYDYEDGMTPSSSAILDAVRVADDYMVMLKKIEKEHHPYEVAIAQYLSSEELRSDPRNHTVPLLEVLDVPDEPGTTLLVMPLLRLHDNPRWKTPGEVVAFVLQVLEGLQFMHELHVAHRDCHFLNIMYDPRPIYPKMFHPVMTFRTRDWRGRAQHSTRTLRPVRYYYIDFGLSRRYNPKDGPPREYPIRGGDKSAPEIVHWEGQPLDPFPTDVYYLGNTIRTTVIQKYRGVEFLIPLVDDMTHEDPLKRPTIETVVRRFHELMKQLGQRQLRSRLIPCDEREGDTFWRNVAHTFRTARYIITRKPAIPLPPTA